MVDRKCPICGAKDATLQVAPEVGVTPDTLKAQWAGFLKEKTFFPFWRCKCGFLFCKEYPNAELLNELYSSMSDNEHSGDSALEAQTKKGYAQNLVQYAGKNHFKNILELGADNGRFVNELNKLADVERFYCVEPNKEMHETLAAIPNVTVYSSVAELNGLDITFDVVVAIHVLDHVPDLDQFTKQMTGKLSTGGICFVVVHNELSLLAKILGKRWPAFCLQHPHLFNQKTLFTWFRQHGFEHISIKRTKNYFSFGYLLEHLVLALGKIKQTFPNLFGVGVKLGNIGMLGIKK